jgi:hypothetical protein
MISDSLSNTLDAEDMGTMKRKMTKKMQTKTEEEQ